jgi:Holliday junction resolvase-like predicted endonuclease
LRTFGELDIVAEKDGLLHFVEVKTVSRETSSKELLRPEENLHHRKLSRIKRAIESYLSENNASDSEFEFHAILVYLDRGTREARIRMLKNLII